MRSITFFMSGLLAAVLCLGAYGQDKKKEVKAELKKFQGKWVPERISVNGADLADDLVKMTNITIKGKKYILKVKDKTLEGSFTVDPSKTPKEIDAILIQDGEKKELKGIYTLQDGKRKTCFALPNYTRPDQFLEKKGYIVLEWEKKKKKK